MKKELNWVMLHPRMTPEMLGYIPFFISEADPRPAREQFDANYPVVSRRSAGAGCWRKQNCVSNIAALVEQKDSAESMFSGRMIDGLLPNKKKPH